MGVDLCRHSPTGAVNWRLAGVQPRWIGSEPMNMGTMPAPDWPRMGRNGLVCMAVVLRCTVAVSKQKLKHVQKLLLRANHNRKCDQMEHQQELIQLIDMASAAAGSDYKLAKLISQPPQRISGWRHAHTTCSPEDQALMASVAGLDPMATLARATVAKHEGKAKGDLLMKVLGKALLATGAVAGSAGASAAQIFSMVEGFRPLSQSMRYFIQCILC